MIKIKEETFYESSEVAGLLELNVRSIHAYIRSGRLKAVKVGVRYYVPENSISDFLGMNELDSPKNSLEKKKAAAQTIVETLEIVLNEYLEEIKLDRSPEAFRKFLTSKLKEAEAERDFWSETLQKTL